MTFESVSVSQQAKVVGYVMRMWFSKKKKGKNSEDLKKEKHK